MKKATKADKPVLARCICGAPPAIVRNRGKKLISCPDPARCSGNYCTGWHPNEEAAVVQWNVLIATAQRRVKL